MPRNIQTPLVSAPRLDAVSAILDKAGANITGSLRGASDTITKLEERKTERNSQNTVLALSQVETEEDLDKFIKNFGTLPEGVRGKVNGNVIEAIAGKRQEIIGNERNKAQTDQAVAGTRASNASTEFTKAKTAELTGGDASKEIVNNLIKEVGNGTISSTDAIRRIAQNPNIKDNAGAVEAFTTGLETITNANNTASAEEFAETINSDLLLADGKEVLNENDAYQLAADEAERRGLPTSAINGLATAIINNADYKKISTTGVDPEANKIASLADSETKGREEFIAEIGRDVAPPYYSTEEGTENRFAEERKALGDIIDEFVTAVRTSEGADKLDEAQIQYIAKKHFRSAGTKATKDGFFISGSAQVNELPAEVREKILADARADILRTVNARANQISANKAE